MASISISSTFVTAAGGLGFQGCQVQWGAEVNQERNPCVSNQLGYRELVLSVWEQGPFTSVTDSGMRVLSSETGMQASYCLMIPSPSLAS